jgi:Na+-transporting methylmalonyl-CoA/oxaloacetate decarboxylase gamma subunit
VLVVLALVAGAVWFVGSALLRGVAKPVCTIRAAGITETFTPEQAANAALITAIAVRRELPPRAATIAITTAYQESKIRNLRYGDRDSLGLFQQRPSQGWGTAEQILDPVFSTNAFYDALVRIKGYETEDITTIAQRVQRSAYPEAYRDHEDQGRVLASTLSGWSPAGLTCDLAPATTHAQPSTVAADLAEQTGSKATTSGGGLTVATGTDRQAWAIAHWAVARAEAYGITAVRIGDRVWDRTSGAAGWSKGVATTTVRIDLS